MCKLIKDVYLQFIPIESVQTPNTASTPGTAVSNSGDYFFREFFKGETTKETFSKLANVMHKKEEIEKEILHFSSFIVVENFHLKKVKKISTYHFWKKYQLQIPNLARLARILLNIQSSSAYIERFFSICGIVCHQRRLNMKYLLILIKYLLINRSLLKANLSILKEMNGEIAEWVSKNI